jgi:N-glycosylase/DNA lyase
MTTRSCAETSALLVYRDGERRRTVPWHTEVDIGSAAFWVAQTQRATHPRTHRLGATLGEEAAACLLGGHGVTGEMTLAAFRHLRDNELLRPGVSETDLLVALRAPLTLTGGRTARYRFPAQRAGRLHRLFRALPEAPECRTPGAGPALRAWLMQLPGFGPKTASWAARNHTGSEQLAVIDIHVHRAGLTAGVFEETWTLPRDYLRFESAFVAWAEHGLVRTSDLDACIWFEMSRLGQRRLAIFGEQPSDVSA